MPLLTNILLILSLFLSISLAWRTGRNLKTKGMPALFSIIVFFSVWVGGDLIELNASSFFWMLWGRNIQQIGVFFTPLCTLFFSIEYTASRRLRTVAYLISLVQIVSVLLIFTDQAHHIMRESVTLEPDAVLGQALVVHSSKIGSALVAFNFCVPMVSIAALVAFTTKVSAQLKRPLWLIIISIFLTFILALVQSTILIKQGISIPIPVLNLPCLILFSYAVLKDGFVGVSPTALSKVFEVIDQGIIVVDAQGKVVEFNRRAGELAESLALARLQIGSNVGEFLYPDAPAPSGVFQAGAIPTELQGRQRRQYLALAYHPLNAFNGKLLGYVLVLTDITQLKVRAEIDSLTGSYNREGLVNAFSDLKKDAGDQSVLSALIVDLDNFKAINDTYGHLAGDVTLCDFVDAAQALLAEKRFLGRLGGDEFVIILPTDRMRAAMFAEKLRRSVSARSVAYLDHTIRYTVSVGIASCQNAECSLSDLLHQADLALYEAKRQGKNAVSVRPVAE